MNISILSLGLILVLSACHGNSLAKIELEQQQDLLQLRSSHPLDMPSCHGVSAGVISINAINVAERSRPLLLPLGSELLLSSALESKEQKITWLIQVPGKTDPLLFQESEVRLTPMHAGVVRISMVRETSDGGCKTAHALVGMHYEEPMRSVGLKSPTLEPHSFSHLIELEVLREITSPGGATPTVAVAVLDTGVNYNHPDLNARILPGWDFVDGDAHPYDDQGHGTHVAGLVAGSQSGVSSQARIIPVRVLNTLGMGRLKDIDAGIRFAVDQGARILVLSFIVEGFKAERVLRDAIQYAGEKGALIFAAAGNQGRNLDLDRVDSLAISLENWLNVGALVDSSAFAPYSNYGPQSVTLAAPGGSPENGGLLSTSHLPEVDTGYVRHWGTSMAAPLAAGVAADMLAATPDLTAVELKAALLAHAERDILLIDKVSEGRKLRAAGIRRKTGS